MFSVVFFDICYNRCEDPQIAVCVIIEGGDSGNNVAPVVRDIYDAYFYSDKNNADGTSDGTTGTQDVGAYDVIA